MLITRHPTAGNVVYIYLPSVCAPNRLHPSAHTCITQLSISKKKKKNCFTIFSGTEKPKYVMQLTERYSDFPRACALNLNILDLLLVNILWSKKPKISCLVRTSKINHFNEYCYVKSPGRIWKKKKQLLGFILL